MWQFEEMFGRFERMSNLGGLVEFSPIYAIHKTAIVAYWIYFGIDRCNTKAYQIT